ncbi:Phosphate:acyl-ACP acyltransferase PlsX [Desulfurella amilsii]|uniref:Phosphate acyltransferase n=1 Tax=Desulfurella amilsii TaxID=1562698 RepID=A0A1X4XZN6_9BACT|nr:phosphate acyltransferase PlsX [Desulfurella amilsii]OSS43011.1 Phosphate:acyl-ACP acyltransferase PlsX [Desulfurella amilsii]
MKPIAVDAFGGDNAPKEIILGAFLAAKEFDLDIVLVGKKGEIEKNIETISKDFSSNTAQKITIEDAPNAITMFDKPSVATRKRNSSMHIGMELVKNKKADAFISAGNSGAVMAIAMVVLGKLKGISRPAIGALLPTVNSSVLLLDAGANVDCKPIHLLEFSIMGSVYIKHMLGVQKPRVGLISNGSEPGKGNSLVLKTYDLIKPSTLNFCGNIEGNEIFSDKVDVAVCDGFVGNIILKTSESVPNIIGEFLKAQISRSLIYKIGYLLSKPAFRMLKKKTDYAEFGGAPLLGVNGACIISHGRSKAYAIKNAILKAAKFASLDVNLKIEEAIEKCSALKYIGKEVENAI